MCPSKLCVSIFYRFDSMDYITYITKKHKRSSVHRILHRDEIYQGLFQCLRSQIDGQVLNSMCLLISFVAYMQHSSTELW